MDSVANAISLKIPQVTIPLNYKAFINDLTALVNSNEISMSRIDDAVRRILRVKFTAGLFENPTTDRSFLGMLGNPVSIVTIPTY